MNTKLLVSAMAAISLSACSTIANGKHQAVMFSTGAVKGADCQVTEGRNGAQNISFQTPAEVQIRRAKASIMVECEKEGYELASRRVESNMEGTTGGNVVAGGFVGLGVDAMTGAMFKYPDTVLIDMEKIGVTSPTVTGDPVS